jgi:hypothetical protein
MGRISGGVPNRRLSVCVLSVAKTGSGRTVDPHLDIVKRRGAGDIVNKDGSVGAAVVHRSLTKEKIAGK